MQQWNGEFFAKTSLREAGLRIHLGHGGLPCHHTKSRVQDFVVYDTTGYHTVDVTFCGCYDTEEGYVPHWTHLLRVGWYPATHARPRSAFTFRLMDFFHELTLQSKVNLHDFHRTLERITDKCQLHPVKVCSSGPNTTGFTHHHAGALQAVPKRNPAMEALADAEASWPWSCPRRSRHN